MKRKKVLLFLGAGIIVYFSIGLILLRFEKIQNLYFFPGYKIQFGNDPDEDQSGYSSDGPLVLHDGDQIVSHSISPKDRAFVMTRKSISKTDTLTCFIDETNQHFTFQLQDSLLTESSIYPMPSKMLVLSDIEGNFKGFYSILKGTGIVNKNFDWTFGNGHLVLAGDFFDRGLNVNECLWLIYKLETEAKKQGGKVHFLLGNHEVMNLRNHTKYVRDKYWDNADSLKIDYSKWYDKNTELGRWLRSKNGIEKIGNYLFVQAGVSKDFPKNKYSLSQINDNVRKGIDQVFEKGQERDNLFVGNESPIWYRGISQENESSTDVAATLKSFGVDKMIVGHTVMDKIQYLYDGKVVAIDLDHKTNSDAGKMFALWIENNRFYEVNQNGNKRELMP